MKIIITEQQKKFLIESIENLPLVYHGTPIEHNFKSTGDLFKATFFSLSQHEASMYGEHIYKVKLKPHLNIFNTININDVNKLFNTFDILYDEYYDEIDEITSPEELMNHEDNWNIIENTDGVLSWLNNAYDGVWVYEGGVKNLLMFSPILPKIDDIIKII